MGIEKSLNHMKSERKKPMAKKKGAKKKVVRKKKTAKRKSTVKRVARGKKAVRKGTQFENDVAELFRLLGAHVKQNIMICNKKVDVFATFRLPGSSTEHRVIVECKNEKKPVAQNQRVLEFTGLIRNARKADLADSAEIITRAPWSDQAKGAASDSGIELLTYTEKVAQLIDFSTYLKETVSRFAKKDRRRPTEPPLGAYYVDLSGERVTNKGTLKIPAIDTYVKKWLDSEKNSHQLAILGEYGMGKSSFCQKLAHDLAASYLQVPGSTRIPILLNLREFTKSLKIESLVLSFLDEECGVMNPRFKLFEAMNEAGAFALIFDGFDEMAVKVDQDTLEINLQEIEKLAAVPDAKVIITSRPEYFVSSQEQETSLSPAERLLAMRETEYKPLHIVLWDEPQISLFLEKRVPLIKKAKEPWTYYRDRIRNIADLSDLSRRPVLLDMIVKTLPDLIKSDKPINRPNLYETYLLGEIKRQKILKKRKLLLTDAARFSLLEHLSMDFYTGAIDSISFSDAIVHMERLIKPPRAELESFTRDFLTCSFLMRKHDEYYFSHKSIMEYLVAKGFIKEIEANIPDAFGRQPLQTGVKEFLAEMEPNRDILMEWIKSTRSGPNRELLCIGGNAATLLCKLDPNGLKGKDLSRTVLNGAILSLADLTGTSFKAASLSGVNLTGARFGKKVLADSKAMNITLGVYALYNPNQADRDPYHSCFRRLATARAYSSAILSPDHCSTMMQLEVADRTQLESAIKAINGSPGVQITAIYANEIAHLSKRLPNGLRPTFDRFVKHCANI